jgi:predicted permease
MEIFAKVCKRKLSRSTASIKIAAVLIYLVLILHIVGFALPYWLKIVWIQADIGDDSFDIQRTEFVGLWQNCSSNTSAVIKDFEWCVRKPSFTGT